MDTGKSLVSEVDRIYMCFITQASDTLGLFGKPLSVIVLVLSSAGVSHSTLAAVDTIACAGLCLYVLVFGKPLSVIVLVLSSAGVSHSTLAVVDTIACAGLCW